MMNLPGTQRSTSDSADASPAPATPAAPAALAPLPPLVAGAGHGPSSARSWLAVEAGGLGLLLPLHQAGEIFPLPELLPVAHTRPWFLGVANLRGGLHGVVDLAVFLGLAVPTAGTVAHAADASRTRSNGRLLALNPELRALCALKVDHLSGLRRLDDGMQAVRLLGPCPSFAVAVWRDAEGRLWQELDLAMLATSEAFLAIGEEAHP